MTDPHPDFGVETDALKRYTAALRRYDAQQLATLLAPLGGLTAGRGIKIVELAQDLTERLSDGKTVERLIADLDPGPRAALGLMAMTESAAWPIPGLLHASRVLGFEPHSAILSLLERGLLALRVDSPSQVVVDLAGLVGAQNESTPAELIAHPGALAAARTVVPEGALPRCQGEVRQIREADGLEPILRLAALWQRVAETPLRQTQQGTIYKRDRERLEDDPVLAGPIADAIEPLPDMVPLWLALARAVGLVVREPHSDREIAAPAAFWTENSVHLPQMIAMRWLNLRGWHEQIGIQEPGSPIPLALPFARPAILLWLATVGEGDWVAIEDLAGRLNEVWPAWSEVALSGKEQAPEAEPVRLSRARGRGEAQPDRDGQALLEAIFLGPAYQLGLVRAGEETPSGRRVVQLTPLGRYALAVGLPAPPRTVYEHFLWVQPNFEIIAYRQGLSPALIGHFSRFAHWSQIGAAIEMRLTPESVYRGLESGLAPDEMLGRLARHSARPLPAGIAEAVRTWSGRRDRVTYYAAATLIEFPSPQALETALQAWPADESRAAPVRISDRLLLVEEESAIPFHRFRLAGARDYRRPAEACLDVEADGITLTLDLGRSDLLVDAELARVAEEIAADSHAGAGRRRFRITPASLARAAESGLTAPLLSQWFLVRTGGDIPPAVRLLLYAANPRASALQTARPTVLTAPSAELLDGLLQHPETSPYFSDRLGPRAAVVPDAAVPALRQALGSLGLALEDDGSPAVPGLRLKRQV